MIAVDSLARAASTEAGASALLYVASERYTCRILDLGKAGLLLAPPAERAPGRYGRLNLSLPAFEQMVDIDGLITDSHRELGIPFWSVAFIDPPDEASELIDRYLERRQHGAIAAALGAPGSEPHGRTLVGYAAPAPPPPPRQRVFTLPPPLPPDVDEPLVRAVTGPHPYVTTGTYPGPGRPIR